MYVINMKLKKAAIRSTKYKMKRSGEKGIKDFFKPKRILIDCEEEERVASSSSLV